MGAIYIETRDLKVSINADKVYIVGICTNHLFGSIATLAIQYM